MRRFFAVIFGWLALGGVAFGQTPATSPSQPAPGGGYAEFVGQSAFGNVTSQSYGAEVGFKVAPNVQIFGEVGRVTNAAPASLGADAAVIAGALTLTQSNVTYQAKEPMTFGDFGARFLVPMSGKVAPYVLAGGGVARVQKNVTFSVGGTDVTSSLSQQPYYVVLGTGLSGTETKPLLTLGGGVAYHLGARLILDFQYRYGRVFTSEGINVNRAGAGIGVRF